MGMNTMMCKTIQMHLESNPAQEKLVWYFRWNVGLVFIKEDHMKEDLTKIRDMLLANEVPAVPMLIISLHNVTVPIQNTGQEPETSFIHVLGITTKSPEVPLKLWVMCNW